MDNQFIRRFCNWLGDKPICGSTLLAYRSNLAHCGMAPSSRNRHLQSLMPWLNEQRIAGSLAMTKDDIKDALKRFKAVKPEPVIIKADEVKRLVDAACKADRNLARFVLLGLTTGARPGEVVNLKGDSFRPDERCVRVHDAKAGGRERRVLVQHSATLTALCDRLSGNGLMKFGSRAGLPDFRAWHAFCASAKVGRPDEKSRCRWRGPEMRAMRRTCESFVASSGKVPQPVMEEWFGHSHTVAFEHYRLVQQVAAGDTLEEWMGCPESFKALLEHAFGESA